MTQAVDPTMRIDYYHQQHLCHGVTTVCDCSNSSRPKKAAAQACTEARAFCRKLNVDELTSTNYSDDLAAAPHQSLLRLSSPNLCSLPQLHTHTYCCYIPHGDTGIGPQHGRMLHTH